MYYDDPLEDGSCYSAPWLIAFKLKKDDISVFNPNYMDKNGFGTVSIGKTLIFINPLAFCNKIRYFLTDLTFGDVYKL